MAYKKYEATNMTTHLFFYNMCFITTIAIRPDLSIYFIDREVFDSFVPARPKCPDFYNVNSETPFTIGNFCCFHNS